MFGAVCYSCLEILEDAVRNTAALQEDIQSSGRYGIGFFLDNSHPLDSDLPAFGT